MDADSVGRGTVMITYQMCADALLKMWMDGVLTDGEYNHIMDKLNAWNRREGERDGTD